MLLDPVQSLQSVLEGTKELEAGVRFRTNTIRSILQCRQRESGVRPHVTVHHGCDGVVAVVWAALHTVLHNVTGVLRKKPSILQQPLSILDDRLHCHEHCTGHRGTFRRVVPPDSLPFVKQSLRPNGSSPVVSVSRTISRILRCSDRPICMLVSY